MAMPNTRLPKDTIVTITGFGWLTIATFICRHPENAVLSR
jgi:hypothetical protein